LYETKTPVDRCAIRRHVRSIDVTYEGIGLAVDAFSGTLCRFGSVSTHTHTHTSRRRGELRTKFGADQFFPFPVNRKNEFPGASTLHHPAIVNGLPRNYEISTAPPTVITHARAYDDKTRENVAATLATRYGRPASQGDGGVDKGGEV